MLLQSPSAPTPGTGDQMFLQLGATRNPSDSFPLGFSWRLPKDGQKEETQHWEAMAGDSLGALLVPRGHIQLVALCQEGRAKLRPQGCGTGWWCCAGAAQPRRARSAANAAPAATRKLSEELKGTGCGSAA